MEHPYHKLLEMLKQSVCAEAFARANGYDSLKGGAGEAYAELHLAMVKAPPGTKGYDGIIDGRRVQVKMKCGTKIYSNEDSQHYVEIDKEHRDQNLVDDVLMVLVVDQTVRHFGPAPISKITPYETKNNKLRYFLKDIKKAME